MADMMMWHVQLDKKNKIISAKEGRRALEHFKSKYHRTPSTIFVNPEQEIEDIQGITIKENKSVMKQHMYIAENESDIEPQRKDINYRDLEEYN